MMNRDGAVILLSEAPAVGEQVLCEDSTLRYSRPPTEEISGPYLRSYIPG